MKPILIVGMTIVNFALICYLIGIITEQKSHRISRRVLTFLSVGVFWDVSATACMITGSSHGLFTLHGILGYSSLAVMLADTILVWRYRRVHGETDVPRSLHLFSRYAMIWWVLAYITGAALVMARRVG